MHELGSPEGGGRLQCTKDRVLVITFGGLKCSFGTSYGVQPQKVCSRSFCGTFQGIKLRKCDRIWCVCVFLLQLVSFRVEKHFKPRLQNRILVPLRGSVRNFWWAFLSFFIWEFPPWDGEVVKNNIKSLGFCFLWSLVLVDFKPHPPLVPSDSVKKTLD